MGKPSVASDHCQTKIGNWIGFRLIICVTVNKVGNKTRFLVLLASCFEQVYKVPRTRRGCSGAWWPWTGNSIIAVTGCGIITWRCCSRAPGPASSCPGWRRWRSWSGGRTGYSIITPDIVLPWSGGRSPGRHCGDCKDDVLFLAVRKCERVGSIIPEFEHKANNHRLRSQEEEQSSLYLTTKLR